MARLDRFRGWKKSTVERKKTEIRKIEKETRASALQQSGSTTPIPYTVILQLLFEISLLSHSTGTFSDHPKPLSVA